MFEKQLTDVKMLECPRQSLLGESAASLPIKDTALCVVTRVTKLFINAHLAHVERHVLVNCTADVTESVITLVLSLHETNRVNISVSAEK